MDILLSLPILSYVFSTGSGSWSTSLNLLFFYMTWTTLVLSLSPLRVHLAGLVVIRVGLSLAPSLLFLAFDCLVPSLAECIKLGGAAALPPRRAGQLGSLLALAFLNLGLSVALEGGIAWAVGQVGLGSGGGPPFRTSTTLPMPWQVVRHVAILLVAREVLTYHLHRRVLHSASSRVGRLHAAYAHGRAAPPFALGALADHPVPHFVHRVLPLLLPALVLRPHLLTYLAAVGLAAVEETLTTSGYSVVPGVMMGGISRRTAAHYAGGGASNFGAWGVLDWACGTAGGGAANIIEDAKAEAERHGGGRAKRGKSKKREA